MIRMGIKQVMLSLLDFLGRAAEPGYSDEASSQPCSAPSASRPSGFDVTVHRDHKIKIAKHLWNALPLLLFLFFEI